MTEPAVGLIVHYQTCGGRGDPRAAIITQLGADSHVGLAIFTPAGVVFNPDVPYAPAPMEGHWNWPPRA